MEDNNKIGISIFKQVCEVNDLDPEEIKKIAKQNQAPGQSDENEAEHLIRTAFNCKARALTKTLDLGSTTASDNIKDGEEYTISADPAAPSFTINDEYIHNKYSEDEAGRLIEALGNVMLPIRA